MAYTTINKSTDYFNTKLYTGTGSEHAITGIGHQPDWVWLKKRSGTGHNWIQDTVRGITYQLRGNTTAVQNNYSQYVKSIQSDGYTLGTDADINGSGSTYIGWNWKAGGTASANTNGSINSTVSASPTSGFSIVKFTGTGSAGTIGHGLSSAPELIIAKGLGVDNNWLVFNSMYSSNDRYLAWQDTAAQSSSSTAYWNNTAPTNTVFSNGTTQAINTSGQENIAYCFHSVTGFSKMGVYLGNGNADGTFVYTGFKPAFIMLKNANANQDWLIHDNKRDPDNLVHARLSLTTNADYNSDTLGLDFLSNGFKIRTTNGAWNQSGQNYIFMCFAEAPLVGSNNVPCTAR